MGRGRWCNLEDLKGEPTKGKVKEAALGRDERQAFAKLGANVFFGKQEM